jgi:flagellar biosynthesis protein FlhF
MNATPQPTLRTFRGTDSRSVLAAVKAALGSEAMIVSTREIPGSLFRSSAVEVTAAVEPEPIPLTELAPNPAPAFVPSEALVDRASALYGETARRPGVDVNRELDALRACVAETQSALSTVARQARMGQDLQLAPAAAQFNTHLSMLGFDPILAEELVRQLMQGGVPRTAAGFRVPARNALGRVVKSCPPPWQVPELGTSKRRVIALIGPTGVGKTTTLAKIAARALLDHKLKVALITFDTYRIGAAEQIAHYGNLMDVPTFVARDRSELCTALSRCPQAQLVLIDTAGRSNMEDVTRQAELARSVAGIELHLVLSAVTSAADLTAISRRYRPILPAQLIFTKVDEASAPGALLSAVAATQRPVGCIANGQRVPEDIHGQSDDDLVNLILGESQWVQGRSE